MAQPRQDYHNTVPIADTAMRKIGALGQPADPKSYALWFKYASGDSGLLSAAINTRLTRNGTLSAGDIDELYDAHIAPGRRARQDRPDRRAHGRRGRSGLCDARGRARTPPATIRATSPTPPNG